MTRTLIDVDDDALARAAEVLGTSTKVDTVNTALRLIAGRQAQQTAVDGLLRTLAANSDLADERVMHGARCRADYDAPAAEHDQGCSRLNDQKHKAAS